MAAIALPSPPLAPSALVKRREPPLAIAFGLIGALLAFAMMRAMDTDWVDAVAFNAGIAAAAIFAALAAVGVQALATRPRFRAARWLVVPLAGACVGMVVQAVQLRVPVTYVVSMGGLSKADPVLWTLAGAPLGAFPAMLATGLLALTLRITGTVPPLDARERMIVPLAAGCAILGALGLLSATPVALPAIVAIVVLATAALVEVIVRDSLRVRFLAKLFTSQTAYEVVPVTHVPSEVPAFSGGVVPHALIVPLPTETSYRSASRAPLASTAFSLAHAMKPLAQRRLVTALILACSLIVTLAALLAR